MYARPLHQGRPLTFGVSGMLWRSSLLMFDRESESLWSHVTGNAVSGPLAGARLRMLPAIHTTWALWRATHPDTLALAKRSLAAASQPHRLESDYALGVFVEDEAVGFPFAELERSPLAHVSLSGRPLLVVYVKPAATAVAFRREVGGRVLTFQGLAPENGGWRIEDRETRTRWNAVSGEAVSGPLAGEELKPVPATQAYLTSWRTLYPGGRSWRAPR
ncbi:MAG: DUF3179 domain-containing protein [Candidatus Rokubacteria bacterium]|nr:DUF3179 domain-containing protein [Candidatus Rokubacteria bacterium]